MNILFVWTSSFEGGGGVGRVTTTLGTEFVKAGHRVSYLSLSSGKDFVNERGITQYYIPDGSNIISKKNKKYVHQILRELEIDIIINQSGIYKQILKLLNSVKTNDIKIISVHHNCIKCLQQNFGTIIKDNFKDKSYYSLISNPIIIKFLKYINRLKYGYYFKYCINNSDRLALLSEKLIPELDTYFRNFPKNKVVGIPNPAPFEPSPDSLNIKENRIIYVGRINFQQKRTELLLKIWKVIQNQNPDWNFDIIGDGPGLKELKKLAVQNNLERIHFHGYQNPIPFLKKAKIFTMVSAFEGFPMVLVEAQAYGVVPIAFDSFGAITDVIQNAENGFIIEPFNTESYAVKLDTLMKDERQGKEMAIKAIESVKIYSSRKVTKEWEELFVELLQS